jgi:hypothetical protein
MGISKQAIGRSRRLKNATGFDHSCDPLERLNMKKANEVMVGAASRRRPVRVKLQWVNADLSKTYPPDGEGKIWWARLKETLGTSSSDFVNASLFQLQKAAQLPCGGISEVAMNAALALIEAAAPQNEIEGALAVQMACTHTAAISVLARFGGSGGSERRVAALASAAARLLRAYSGQVEIFRRLRHGSDQYVRVEHVHVNEGGQTVIGNIRTQGGALLGGDQAMGNDPNGEGPPTSSR